MARKEYAVVDIVDVLRRVQSGYSIRAIARATGMDRNTLRKYLRLAYKKGFVDESPCDLDAIAREVVREAQSNVPGPERPLYFRGWRLEAVHPLSIPFNGCALNITVQSYAGTLNFGFIGCREALPHLQRLAVYAGEALDEIEAAG